MDGEFTPFNSITATMLEKDSRASMLDCVEEVSSLASENTRTSNHCSRNNNIDSTSCEFHPNGPILDDKNAAVEENLYSYSVVPISQADDDLSFLDSNHEENTTDLLYYSWPEMENFEDVDRMFKSCDSSFGLGASIEDDLGWFSSSDVIEGSGGGLRSDFEFPCPSSRAVENIYGSQEASRRKETGSSINDSGTKDEPFSHTGSSMPSEDESAIQNHLSFLKGSSDSDCNLVPEEKINLHEKHSKHQNQSEGKTEDVYLGNGETYNYIDSLPEERKHPTAITGSQVALTSTGIQQQKQVDGSDFEYFQGGISYLSSGYSHSDQTTVAGIGTNENMVDKLLYHPGIKHENNKDLGSVRTGIPAELGSSFVKESSCISFGLNEISEEAKSFYQLQRVMERVHGELAYLVQPALI